MYLKREKLLQEVRQYIGKPLIKVITGMRRSGKTVLMGQIAQEFDEDVVYMISKESKQFDYIVNDDDLYRVLVGAIESGKEVLCVDEVQLISQWEKAILSIFVEYPDVEIFLTGSNSSMLSSELTTLLRGRYVEMHVLPFSYEEYALYHDVEVGGESFGQYIQQGGLPSLYMLDTVEQQSERTNNLIHTIFLRDIVERHKIKDVFLLRMLFDFIVNNAANVTSISRLVKSLGGQGIKTNINTLEIYLRYLKESYLVYDVPLYDMQGKKIFQRERKLYVADHFMRKALFGSFDQGVGKILENIVYLDAVRHGYAVYVGRMKDREVDFVLEKGGEKLYVQVAYMLTHEKVIEREFGNLELIDDNYPKYVVSMDPVLLGNHNGVHHVQAWNRYSHLS